MKNITHWHSDRLHARVNLARWGHYGTPVLIFPTAAGDAEEIERFKLIDSLGDLIERGRIKVYSCDSVAGQKMVDEGGSSHHRMWAQNAFHHFIYHEIVPAIREDCQDGGIEVITAGSSIGAFHAFACLCRFPDVFKKAFCVSGTFDIERFLGATMNEDLYFASPIHFLPELEGPQLEMLRQRFVLFAAGQGRWEDVSESWRAANVLGTKGIPNRVDAWGTEWDHDWGTWRVMYPKYLEEMA